ncbi:MAG: YcgN family cysteine cluster protein [Halioglobus sp.]|nr:YcgN family cysteine cluster protein [Halioglobus sp.]MBP6724850.1 YcgN family cysteine cluster protein [Halioglobus sp.]
MAAVAEWWQTKALAELDPQQWEALCDGCAKCCLHKLEDEDDGEVFYTRVRCRYLDEKSCRCSDYSNRSVLVPNCIRLEPGNVRELDWLPSTCAYRLRARGEPLADWHPLVSGRADSVHRAGVSIRGRSISDEYVHPDGFEEHIIHWVE